MREVVGLTFTGIKATLMILEEFLKTDEPIDPYHLINKSKLEASLKTPFQRPTKTSFKEDIIDKTALLFYLLVENHVLPTNGNKRLATHALLMTLYINNYRLVISQHKLYDLSITVTQLVKNGKKQELVLRHIRGFLRNNIRSMRKKVDPIFKEDFDTFLGR
jgi:death-on-curing family protein